MNKTVSINLGGLFFHIDEDAYQKLNRYFDAIKRSLSPDGKEEIMNDIESRIAELLAEKLKNDKQVVGVREVEEVIAVMGQPEDYRIDEDNTQQNSSSSSYYAPGSNPIGTKKFYRDAEHGMISGVCSGLGHYFRIDPLWIRIIFIISLFASFGSSVFIYILLWILIPQAVTTTEKLEMTGEPINISNIERKVREEIDSFSQKFQNVDYDKLGATAKNGAERIGNTIGGIFSSIFGVFAKVIGAIIVVISAVWLGALLAGLIFVSFSSTMTNAAWYPYMEVLNYTDTPLWILVLLCFFAVGIPVFFLFLLGLKILVNNLRPVGSVTRYTFLAVWIISIALLIYFGMRQATEISSDSKTTQKEVLNIAKNDTLFVKFRYNDYYSKSIGYNTEYKFTQDADNNDVIYSNNISFQVLKTDEAQPYLQIERVASGGSMSEARKRAEKIKYAFEIQGNKLILDNYLLTDVASKFRNQKVELFLYLPEGTKLRPDSSVEIYDWTDNAFFDLWFEGEHTYRMDKDRVNCIDCDGMERVDRYGNVVDTRDYIEYEGKDTITINGAVQIVRDSIRFKEQTIR